MWLVLRVIYNCCAVFQTQAQSADVQKQAVSEVGLIGDSKLHLGVNESANAPREAGWSKVHAAEFE